MNRLILILFIFSAIPSFSYTGSIGYEDYKIGDSKSKIMQMIQSRFQAGDIDYTDENLYTDCNDIAVKTGTAITGTKVRFKFDRAEKLYMIIVSIDNPMDAEVKSIISDHKDKYGRPTSTDSYGLPAWELADKEYIISFTVFTLPVPRPYQKYSSLVINYGNARASKDIYDKDL
jgi:hypothetical protein